MVLRLNIMEIPTINIIKIKQNAKLNHNQLKGILIQIK